MTGSFAARCMDLPHGDDYAMCDGRICGRRRKCIRYMLHVRKRLMNRTGATYYIPCAPRYNVALCYLPYYPED